MKCRPDRPRVLLAALALCASVAPASADDPLLTALSRKYKAATIFLEAESGGKTYPLGTGVVVSDQGHILTAQHIFTGEYCSVCDTAVLYGRIGEREADRIKVERNGDGDPFYDVALLRFQAPGPWARAPVRKLDNPVVGKKLIVLGFPNAERFNVGDGTLSNPNFFGGRWRADIPVMEGNSGGPVFDEEGYVVGIVHGGIPGERLKTVIPIQHGSYFLQLAGLKEAAAMPAFDRPGSIPVYIDIANIAGYSQPAVDSLRAGLKRIGARLRNIRLAPPEQAKYWLGNLSIESDGAAGLVVTGTFGSTPGAGDTRAGSCAECEDDKNGPMRAFADLLHKTLLHPERGPYGPVAIQKCGKGLDRVSMILTVTWRAGPGLEPGLFYEIGQVKDGRLLPDFSDYFLKFEDFVSRENGKLEAEALFRPTPSPNASYAMASCDAAAVAVNEVLLTRLMQRLPSSSGRNANLRMIR